MQTHTVHTKGEQQTKKDIAYKTLVPENHHEGQYLQLCVLLWWTCMHHGFVSHLLPVKIKYKPSNIKIYIAECTLYTGVPPFHPVHTITGAATGTDRT